ncbi:MAG: glycosyltransferase family 2 protein [Pseudomonadota bacterium]
MQQSMNISVVVTCLNEERNIRDCLESLIRQEYQPDAVEIVISDGGSVDRTREIVNQFAEKDPRVRMVVEPKKGTAAGRNAGVRAARHEHIAFIDADCEAPPQWLALLADAFKEAASADERLAAVGGTNIPPPSANTFVRAVGTALDSYLGSFGSVQGRRYKKAVYVSGVSTVNALFSKSALESVGLYDESMLDEGEDADMNFRLKRAGYTFLFVPDSYVRHKMRPTPYLWFRNMFRYGKARARLLKRYPEMWETAYVLPLLYVAAMVSVVLSPFHRLFLLPLLYVPALVIYSAVHCLRNGVPLLTLHVSLVYLIQHLGYGWGEAYGLLSRRVR